MKNNSAVILMSGGLDSLVALSYVLNHTKINLKLALTFDYGQKASANELRASANICKYYGVEHKIIKLDWLRDITNTALVSNQALPVSNLGTKTSAENVWVPNRNALFLNIAASYCDSLGYKYIIYGANNSEGVNFPDNTDDFRIKITEMFKISTLVHPEVLAPLIKYSKDDIVKIALEDGAPIDMIWSCYDSKDKHCGMCESCSHLRNALKTNDCGKYLRLLFGNEN